MTSQPAYVLRHSDHETRRLATQAAFYAEHTDRLLKSAGITAGMDVLDVGCGAGDVSIQLARIVGPTGSVVGLDTDASVLDAARQRVAELNLGNVTFRQATLPDVSLDRPVDAVVGRMILMHLPDPAGTIRAVSTLVRPGGVVTFQDLNTTRIRSVPALPLLTRGIAVVNDCLRAAGRTLDTGERLYSLFREAGLADPELAVAVPTPQDKESAVVMLGQTLLTALPFAEESGVVTLGDLDPDTLIDQLREELRNNPCAIYLAELVAAWTRVPG
ncbi:methyltransferase domain-containing protein [Streptomyces sp. NRRL B-1677]|uniref:class I SAM-dependent methyltransferase n=1 Tax=Streptomyces sp. NRRL B-1677 TaxID=2682966 RepID=UPI001892C9B5|nr:class I SAM-dependent methyltransferase [Streptomyces sp. NRRL B-1677]MBF6050289.1 methyltransferase domain-containing protein [Streptomyces sp. NRRL B-1677]